MKACLRLTALVATTLLAGCVGYGPGYGGYPDHGYPGGAYPGGGYPGGYPPGGYPPGGYPPGGYPGAGPARTVRCESDNNRTRYCSLDTRGGVFLSRRLSDAPCIQGQTWGYDAGGVWVSGGCRAEFTTGGGIPPGYGSGQSLRCESQDGRWHHCDAWIRRGARLVRTVSGAPCIQGQSWGWDRSGIWVDRGCRADFLVY
jgi:hypothetical protein